MAAVTQLRVLAHLLPVLILGSPALAQDVDSDHQAPFARLKVQIEQSADRAGIKLDKERCTLVIAVNKSANIQNGLPGERIRDCILGLFNEFWVKDERFCLAMFQNDVDSWQEFTFDHAARKYLYRKVAGISGDKGNLVGGCIIEAAQAAVLRKMHATPGASVGIVLTHQQMSQEPEVVPENWSALVDAARRQRDAQSRDRGSEWSLEQLATDGAKAPANTWSFVTALRTGSAQTLPESRASTVQEQNRTAGVAGEKEADVPPVRKDPPRAVKPTPTPPTPGSSDPSGWIVLMAALLILTPFALRGRRVTVDDASPRDLGIFQRNLRIVTYESPQAGKEAIELTVSPPELSQGSVAEIRWSAFGGVKIQPAEGLEMRLGNGRWTSRPRPVSDKTQQVGIGVSGQRIEVCSFTLKLGRGADRAAARKLRGET